MDQQSKRRGPLPGAVRKSPIFPEKVKIIVRMRDSGATFDAIAKVVGGTRMGSYLMYRRWHEWARNQ